jgi:lysophospholipase L1-like esterase
MNIKYSILLLSAVLMSADAYAYSVNALPEVYQSAPKNQWKGKKVAYLGDSITDKIHVGTTKNYWQYLQEMLGIEPLVYGINGHQWNGILEQAKKLKAEQGDKIDAIFIFAGTNDYNGSVPLGEWYTTKEEETRVSGPSTAVRKRRITVMDNKTVRGRINMAMDYLKTNFPTQQIIVLTPIHRAFAQFGEKNIQPDESFPNALGLYIDDYVSAIKETANVWAVPVIDLNSICGLYPLKDEYVRYFHDGKTDRLHPNAEGHYRMAKALMYQLLAYPSDFK